MEVYATQPSSEVLKCQQHVVVPNLRLHHHHTAPRLHNHKTHHLQLPKLQIGTQQSISAPASPSCAVTATSGTSPAAAAAPPAFITSSSSSSAPSVEMKRSYEQTKEPTSAVAISRSTKRSIVVGTGKSTSKGSNKSLPLVTPCHKDKMAAAAAKAAQGAPIGLNSNSKMGQTATVPTIGKSNGTSTASNNNNNGEAMAMIERMPASVSAGSGASCEKVESTTVDRDSPRADVFLGGSCNPTTWRTDKAIPLLKKLGISYYNPQVATWCPELISLEHEAKTHAKCLLFVIDSQTRSVVGLIEVAFLAAQGRKVVLVLPNAEREPGQSIMGETISQSEYEELSSAHLLLTKLVERHQIPVFNDLDEAIHCIAKILRDETETAVKADVESASVHNSLEKNLRNVFDILSEPDSGEMKLSLIPRAYRLITKSDLGFECIRPIVERCSQHLSRSQSSTSTTSTIASSSSGDDSPPLKKDLVGEERFKQLQPPMTNGDHDQVPPTSTECISFEEFKYLMTELLDAELNSIWEPPQRFLQRMKDVLERLMDDLTDHDTNANTGAFLNRRLRACDVFLGGPSESGSAIERSGPSNSSTSSWRTEKAIPLLKKHNLTVCSTTDYVKIAKTKSQIKSSSCVFPADDCRVLFIYLNNSSRAVELMTLASYYIGLDRHRLVFCAEDLEDDCRSGDEKLTKIAIKDYNRGRAYITDIAKRNEFPVFQDLDEALQKVVEICNSNSDSEKL